MWDHHPGWELLIVMRGRHLVEFEQGRWQGGIGDALLIPPMTEHRSVGPPDRSLAMMVVQWTGWAPHRSWCGCVDRGGRLLLLSRWLLATQPERQAYRDHLFGALCEELVLLLEDGREPADPIEGIRQVLEQIPEAALDAGQLAAKVHLSIRQMNRRYQARYGCTPMQDLQRLRLEKACALLRGSQLSIQDIAETVGYASAAHLSRAIKQAMGQGPRALRKGWR